MQSRLHRVTINGEAFAARHGEVLLDAALMNGVDIPYDCRSGHCGTCRVRVVSGIIHGRRGGDPHTVQACQCRIVSDVAIVTEDLPDVTTTAGRVGTLALVAPDVVEVRIEFRRRIEYLPGQYFRVQFRGMPVRCFSPTVPMDRRGDDRSIHLHVRRVPNGRVSLALGKAIKKGHRVKVTGPYGSAYLQPNSTNRLVLVAGGTGFAPIWSIAEAAVREDHRREIVLIVGVRSIDSLYMIPALYRLASCPNVTIVPVTETSDIANPAIRVGRPTDHLPELSPYDVIYVAGVPPLVAAVEAAAEGVGATCYSDPFVPQPEEKDGLLARAMNWLSGEIRTSSASTAAANGARRPGSHSATDSHHAGATHADAAARKGLRSSAEIARAQLASKSRRQRDGLATGVERTNASRASLRSVQPNMYRR